MAVATLAEGTPLTIEQANDVFTAVDNVLRVLFNGQSPLLYLSFDDGAGAWEASGLAGLLVVFGTQASRVILSAVASHDQGAIDSAAAAATLGAQDDTLKQVTLGLASGALSKSLVIQKRTVTVGAGTEDYFARVEYASPDHFHHEKVHELAAVDVVFEGHSDRTFEWPTAWNKVRCVRFHNLDSDATPLVVTFEETGETIELSRWECMTMRRVDNGSGITWQHDGFLLWQMRAEDLERLGNSFPWNDRVGAGANVWESVWSSDGGNNVASWASVYRVLDYFAAEGMPVEIVANDGVAAAFDPKTGIAYDLSDITRNAGTLKPFPSPTDTSTPIYKLAWHGGKFIAMSKDGAGVFTMATATASIDALLAGSSALNVELVVDAGGDTAHLKVINGTGVELVDLIPVGSNIGASGHPFTVPDDGVGCNVPPAAPTTWAGINRLVEYETSETVVGLGGNVTTDYTELRVENSGVSPWSWGAFEGTIGDVQGWAFGDGTKNNSHGTFYSNSVKWDGRRLAVNALLRIDPVDGAFPYGPAALTLSEFPSAVASFGYVEWYQAADVQVWPVSGGPWLTPNLVRRSMPPVDPTLNKAHPNAEQYLGTPTGDDYVMRDSRLFRRSKGIKRQLPINDITGGGLAATSVDLTGCYFVAEDSTQTIVENVSTAGWWSTNRATAISGAAIGSEVRPVVAPVLRARHFNVLAQRINAVLSVVPFSFFDAQYYGRDFRPDYTSGGIFGGHVYPYGFVRYNTGTAATRATALSLTVRDFQTEFSGYGVYSNEDVDIIDYSGPGGGTSGRGFDVSNGTGLDLWNTDLPYWFNPSPSPALARNESVVMHKSSPGTGWVQGELVFTDAFANDWYAWQLPNDSAYAFPDFEYLRADDLDGLASDLGIPFRLIRLFASWEPYKFTPDRQGLGVRYVIQWEPSNTWTRTEVRLVPAIISEAFVTFAGTGELWGTHGLVRVSDWPVCPTTQGSDDAVVQQSNADPMHGLNRGSGSGFVIEFPFGFYEPGGTATPTWRNDGPFDGEARHLSFEAYDTTPTPPTGWTAAVHRLASYPVPITEWGASEIETHAAPSCDPAWVRLSDLSQKFDAADLWGQQGSGAWGGEGAFAVHLFIGSIMAP